MKFDHQKGRHFEIDGAKIYVEGTGGKNAPVLLFLSQEIRSRFIEQCVRRLSENPLRGREYF